MRFPRGRNNKSGDIRTRKTRRRIDASRTERLSRMDRPQVRRRTVRRAEVHGKMFIRDSVSSTKPATVLEVAAARRRTVRLSTVIFTSLSAQAGRRHDRAACKRNAYLFCFASSTTVATTESRLIVAPAPAKTTR